MIADPSLATAGLVKGAADVQLRFPRGNFRFRREQQTLPGERGRRCPIETCSQLRVGRKVRMEDGQFCVDLIFAY